MATLKSFNELPGDTKPKKEKTEWQKLKATKRQNIPAILEKKGVKFERAKPNSDANLIILNGDERISYWPGSGRWDFLTGTKRGQTRYTLQDLLEHLGVD